MSDIMHPVPQLSSGGRIRFILSEKSAEKEAVAMTGKPGGGELAKQLSDTEEECLHRSLSSQFVIDLDVGTR
jgi:hypothetical protein